MFSISQNFSVPQALLAEWNGIETQEGLAVGQALVIFRDVVTYTVRDGDTLVGIARANGLSLRELYRLNPGLYGGYFDIFPGDILAVSLGEGPATSLYVNAYAYTFIEEPILRGTLPYLSTLAPFTYGFKSNGELLDLNDEALIFASEEYGTSPIMHLSTLTESGTFSSELAAELFRSDTAQDALIENIYTKISEKGYRALDIDFEFISGENAGNYANFIAKARAYLSDYSIPVLAALAPKTSADQPGTLYEGHNYALIGAAADKVFLMTYEWGYTYGPPMAVAPIGSVRRVLDYAVTEIPPEKIIMGIPNYGYDWTLPYKSGSTRARSISNTEAVRLAVSYGAEIKFDEASQSPYFYYSDGENEHEVWFEDPRSISAKLDLPAEYGFYGVGYWNAMRPFPANWLILSQKYRTSQPF